MILVLLGSHEFSFKRLLERIEDAVKNNIITEEVIVQSGSTPYESSVMNIIPYFKTGELDKLYDKSSYIITHGGTASIIKGVKKGKKVIAIARLEKYREHIDNHQLQIINEFVNAGYIIEWKEKETIDFVLTKLDAFYPKQYKSNRDNIVEYLEKYIDLLS